MYAKVFNQIFDSSIVERPETRFTFVDMLILADVNGVVDMTHEAIARRTNRPIELIRQTISELEGPDPRSRTPDYEGARIKRLDEHRDWGWFIVNYENFRKLASEEQRREKTKLRVRRHRNKECNTPVTLSNDSPYTSSSSSSVHTLEELEKYCTSLGLPASDGEAMFLHWEEHKWPKNWKLTIKKWKLWNYMPSQKIKKFGPKPDPEKETRRDKEMKEARERLERKKNEQGGTS